MGSQLREQAQGRLSPRGRAAAAGQDGLGKLWFSEEAAWGRASGGPVTGNDKVGCDQGKKNDSVIGTCEFETSDTFLTWFSFLNGLISD